MPTFISNIWTNPFTSTGATATVVLTILHALGVNTFGMDSGTLAGIIGGLTSFVAADPGKGATKP